MTLRPRVVRERLSAFDDFAAEVEQFIRGLDEEGEDETREAPPFR